MKSRGAGTSSAYVVRTDDRGRFVVYRGDLVVKILRSQDELRSYFDAIRAERVDRGLQDAALGRAVRRL